LNSECIIFAIFKTIAVITIQTSQGEKLMEILVINTGSSSVKYDLFDMDHHQIVVSGMAEKIGEETSLLIHERIFPMGNL